ncbi:hypothetical protein O181_013244, partial [Austropuccinia psidii MF-1]|nr:hypothetical protein [Austropuccinia psidii MF-1]
MNRPLFGLSSLHGDPQSQAGIVSTVSKTPFRTKYKGPPENQDSSTNWKSVLHAKKTKFKHQIQRGLLNLMPTLTNIFESSFKVRLRFSLLNPKPSEKRKILETETALSESESAAKHQEDDLTERISIGNEHGRSSVPIEHERNSGIPSALEKELIDRL